MSYLHALPSWQIAGPLLLIMALALEGGYRLGRRFGKPSAETHSALNIVKGALLALVGLLLGFSYSMASTRYETRKHLLIEETDAIGTAYLRGDLFDETLREGFRQLMRDYTDARLAFFQKSKTAKDSPEALRRSEDLQRRLWNLGIEQIRVAPHAPNNFMILDSLNKMIERGTERLAARKNEVPQPILVLLMLSSVIAAVTVGHSFGIGDKRSWQASLGFVLVITLAFYVILDLDQPNRGRLKISQEAMVHLRSSMK